MTIPKYRAALLVFLVGFSLGLSVFVATRLFVRVILTNDALAAAGELAADLANGKDPKAGVSLSTVVRYTWFDTDGKAVDSGAPEAGAGQHQLDANQRSVLSDISRSGGAI